MSLAIVFKGPEGIVLAADSRVTLTAQMSQPGGQVMLLPSTFDNATKLLKLQGQTHVGAVTYGAGAIGSREPRTAHSFLPELEAKVGKKRLKVEEFAKKLADFFLDKWRAASMAANSTEMHFLVGGFDEKAAYGRVFEVAIPSRPEPHEWFSGSGEFGAVWGGQKEFVDRLIRGYDLRTPDLVKEHLGLLKVDADAVTEKLGKTFQIPIPYQFLPLQDCIDLSIFLIRLTIGMQAFSIGIRGVGGAIDVARITQGDGFTAVQEKKIRGEQGVWGIQ